jgi:hypothetical protein
MSDKLILDAFFEPTRTVVLKGATYNVKPITVREKAALIKRGLDVEQGGDVAKRDELTCFIVATYLPDFPTEQLYELTPEALNALIKFLLQEFEVEPEKN